MERIHTLIELEYFNLQGVFRTQILMFKKGNYIRVFLTNQILTERKTLQDKNAFQ